MKSTLPLAALTSLVGLSLAAAPSQATVVTYSDTLNGPGACQAFTPGPANTIRNRVVGAENVGTAPMNVACDLTTRNLGSGTGNGLTMWFSNNNPGGTISISCTMLTGFQTGTNKLATHTVTVTPGTQSNIYFAPTDLDPSYTTFGARLVGVNCALPPGGVINDLYYTYTEDDGIGS